MRRFDYAIFDLDGTLLDTREGVIAAVAFAMEKYGKPIPNHSILESLIGPPIQDSFQKLYNLSFNEAMEMANVFRDAYKNDDFLFKAVPYEGIYELMDLLIDSGVEIGIVTYKREDYAKRLLLKKQFDRYTEYMYGSDFKGKKKKYDIILYCLRKMGCDNNSRAVYIGDGDGDGIAANKAGINFIAVNYGFGFKKAHDADDYLPIGTANTCKDIYELIDPAY